MSLFLWPSQPRRGARGLLPSSLPATLAHDGGTPRRGPRAELSHTRAPERRNREGRTRLRLCPEGTCLGHLPLPLPGSPDPSAAGQDEEIKRTKSENHVPSKWLRWRRGLRQRVGGSPGAGRGAGDAPVQGSCHVRSKRRSSKQQRCAQGHKGAPSTLPLSARRCRSSGPGSAGGGRVGGERGSAGPPAGTGPAGWTQDLPRPARGPLRCRLRTRALETPARS